MKNTGNTRNHQPEPTQRIVGGNDQPLPGAGPALDTINEKPVRLPSNRLEIILRKRKTWFLLLGAAYGVSVFWLGGLWFIFPVVIFHAPAGCLHYLIGIRSWGEADTGFLLIAHATAWPSFLLFIFLIKRIDRIVLYTCSALILVILLVTLGGCSQMSYPKGFGG